MRLLIAGWQGQVAQALTDVVPGRADITACAVGRPSLDICEVRTIERALGEVRPDVVINTAAYTNVDAAEDEEERAHALNCTGAGLLATAAAKRGVPILHLSTDYVFDGAGTRPYTETDAARPQTAYGRTKLAGEAAVIAANPRHVILRTAWVFSPFGKNFVKTIAARARDGAELRVVIDQRGSPTYAPHLVDCMLAIARQLVDRGAREDGPWGIYHAAGGGEATWHEIAVRTVAELPDAKTTEIAAITSDAYPARTARPRYSVLDCGKLSRTFGIEMPDWQTGVGACVARLAAR